VNTELAIDGVLLTMYDGRLNLSRQVVTDAREFFGERVFKTTIPRNVRLAEAPSFGKPIILYDIASVGAQAYMSVARELLARQARAGQGAAEGEGGDKPPVVAEATAVAGTSAGGTVPEADEAVSTADAGSRAADEAEEEPQVETADDTASEALSGGAGVLVNEPEPAAASDDESAANAELGAPGAAQQEEEPEAPADLAAAEELEEAEEHPAPHRSDEPNVANFENREPEPATETDPDRPRATAEPGDS
jgi:hypothetical protein